jgi:hypothetical protein
VGEVARPLAELGHAEAHFRVPGGEGEGGGGKRS